jgi:hypothetical protein
MRPDPGKVLMGVTAALFYDITPDVRTPFGQALTGMAGTLTLIVSQEFDRMVDRLAQENDATVALLERGLELADGGLRTTIEAALTDRTPADFRVATFQAINDRLRGALVELHVAVEAMDSDAARALNEAIWVELAASTKRRDVQLPGR